MPDERTGWTTLTEYIATLPQSERDAIEKARPEVRAQLWQQAAENVEAELAQVKAERDAARERIARLEGAAVRWRAIEHHAWHLLDESEDRGGGEHVIDDESADYKALDALLPENHPLTVDEQIAALSPSTPKEPT